MVPSSASVVKPDLMAVVKQAEGRTFKYIRAGETNIKSYLFICIVKEQLPLVVRTRTPLTPMGLSFASGENKGELRRLQIS